MIPRARWQQIQSLFQQTVDMTDAERAAHLDKYCGDDSGLRGSVQSLLALIGTRVGPYRVVSILGHGGMSTVYRGERDDSQYHQTVAIKVLQHAAVHPRLRSRLHSERHILATLDHPSIARL